jgi:hypothetical protein
VQFFPDTDGSYTANVRMFKREAFEGPDLHVAETCESEDEGVGARADGGGSGGEEGKAEGEGASSPRRGAGLRSGSPGGGEEGGREGRETSVMRKLAESDRLFGLQAYEGLTRLLSVREDTRPTERPQNWVMRHVEDLYDNRFDRDTMDLAEEEAAAAEGKKAPARPPQSFPAFVASWFSAHFGLKTLVDRVCWDLVYSVHRLRGTSVDVELFARFLEQKYDPDDLLFFLYVRSVLQKQLKLSLRARWAEMGTRAGATSTAARAGPEPILLTLGQVRAVLRAVFGSESDALFKALMTVVERFMQSEMDAGRSNADAEGIARIDASDLLRIALEEYHDTRPAADDQDDDHDDDGADTDRLVTQAEQEYAARHSSRDSAARDSAAHPSSSSASASASAPAPAPPSSSSSSSSSAAAAPVAVAPEVLQRLTAGLQRANDAYIASLCRAAEALPREVTGQVRSELDKQLKQLVDQQLTLAINATTSGAPVDPVADPVSAAFQRVLRSDPAHAAALDSAVQHFCDELLATKAIRERLEPMAAMLISYAFQRMQAARP